MSQNDQSRQGQSFPETLEAMHLEGEGPSRRWFGKANKRHREETGESAGLSPKRMRVLEEPQREETRERLHRGLLGTCEYLEEEFVALGHIRSSAALALVLYSDGYTPFGMKPSNARTRFSVGIIDPLSGLSTRGLTVVDLKKAEYAVWEHGTLIDDIALVHRSSVMRNVERKGKPRTLVSRFFVLKITGDHLDQWCKVKGCGGRGHKCTMCAIPMSQWLLMTHRFPHLSLQEMSDAGFPSFLAGVAPNAHFVSPPLHDLKGMAECLRDVMKPQTTGVFDSVCRHFRYDLSGGNSKGSQMRDVIRKMAELADYPLVDRLMFISLSELSNFRYGDVPWRHHAKAEPAALFPFLRARIAGHVFLCLMETVSPKSTLSTYCHSMQHWWSPLDAVPLLNNDEPEEQENGQRKRGASNTSVATYEEIQATSEVARRARQTPWKVADLSDEGLKGKKDIILCPCISSTHAMVLATYVLCTQLSEKKSGFVFFSGGYCLFRFPKGRGRAKVCLCSTDPPSDEKFELFVASDNKFNEFEAAAIAECDEENGSQGNEEPEGDGTAACDFCEKPMAANSLAVHIDNTHRRKDSSLSAVCPISPCSKTVKSLTRHMELKHPDFFFEENRCKLCFLLFQSSEEWVAHCEGHA